MPILTLLGLIFSQIGSVVSQVVGAIGSVLNAVWQMISVLVEAAPAPFKILIFLFLLVTVGNIFTNVAIGSQYVCTTTNNLYKAPDIFSGIFNNLKWIITGRTDADITSSYTKITIPPATTSVRCSAGTARLFFYSVDILDYKLWLLIVILIGLSAFASGYYRKTGVTN